MTDPRIAGSMPKSGPVRLFHASEAAAADLRSDGLAPGSDGVLWLASSPEIAELQNSAGTRARDIQTLIEVEVDAKLLEYERTNGDVHVFYLLSGDPFTVVTAEDWPTPPAASGPAGTPPSGGQSRAGSGQPSGQTQAEPPAQP